MSAAVLEVRDLCKRYPQFALEHVSFSLEEGHICGFIGRNGAGKSTTLKSLLRLVHPDGGSISFFGSPFQEAEQSIKEQIGYVAGGFEYYPRKKLRDITAVSRRFYQNWDGQAYARYLSLFQLSEDKTPAALSAGMKVKYALTLALSHHARLLILDEPTSGLDPVSREELLEVFLRLVREEGVAILFSTHITSDLDKCADDILYIRRGVIAESGGIQSFVRRYRLAERETPMEGVVGQREGKRSFTGLILPDQPVPEGARVREADLEDIMVHLEKEEQ